MSDQSAYNSVVHRALVRMHAYEFLTSIKSEYCSSFYRHFAKWQPRLHGVGVGASSRHPVHRICDVLHQYFDAHDNAEAPPLDALCAAVASRTPLGINVDEVSERLNRDLYSYWGKEPLEVDDLISDLEVDCVGRSSKWVETLRVAHRAARSDFPVLIYGETGVGKELIAELIHRYSLRSNRSFKVFNCAALPESLVESELFGYSPGAFTGAAAKGKRGWVEEAEGGTLVLDEVSELNPRAQAALLRALQFGEVQRIGGEMVKVNFRLVSITNRQLEHEVESGRFRRDLFYRIAVLPIAVPPLRERPDDIEPLADHFLEKFQRVNRTLLPKRFSPAAMKTMMAYDWRGNVRELENIVARAMVLTRGEVIEPRHLVFHTDGSSPSSPVLDRLRARISGLNSELPKKIDPDALAEFLHRCGDKFVSSDYAKRFGTSEATARRHLGMLNNAGLLNKSGSKRGTKYSVDN